MAPLIPVSDKCFVACLVLIGLVITLGHAANIILFKSDGSVMAMIVSLGRAKLSSSSLALISARVHVSFHVKVCHHLAFCQWFGQWQISPQGRLSVFR